METLHPEGESPSKVKSDSASGSVAADEDLEYTDCPVDGCGEILPRGEMDFHLELHAEEAGGDSPATCPDSEPVAVADPGPSLSGGSSSRYHHRDRERDRDGDISPRHRHSERSHRKPSSTPTTQSRAISAWKKLLKMPGSSPSPPPSHSSRRHHGSEPITSSEKQANAKRLGKAQLGRYAHEERMPDWLVAHLQKGGQVKSEGMAEPLQIPLQISWTNTNSSQVSFPFWPGYLTSVPQQDMPISVTPAYNTYPN